MLVIRLGFSFYWHKTFPPTNSALSVSDFGNITTFAPIFCLRQYFVLLQYFVIALILDAINAYSISITMNVHLQTLSFMQ